MIYDKNFFLGIVVAATILGITEASFPEEHASSHKVEFHIEAREIASFDRQFVAAGISGSTTYVGLK